MTITSKFDFGQKVYLKTDTDQSVRIVTSFECRPTGIIYQLSCGSSHSWHYEFEISEEKDVMMATTN